MTDNTTRSHFIINFIPFKGIYKVGTGILVKQFHLQECIPVGCVPAAEVAMGLSAQGGVCLGVSPRGDVSQHALGAYWDTQPPVDRILDTRL